MATIFNTADIAARFSTDTRTLRKFLRDDARANDLPIMGKGSRWGIEGKQVRSLHSRFNKWTAAQDEAKAAREAKKAEEAKLAADTAPEVEDEVADDAEVEGPTDADIAALEDEVLEDA